MLVQLRIDSTNVGSRWDKPQPLPSTNDPYSVILLWRHGFQAFGELKRSACKEIYQAMIFIDVSLIYRFRTLNRKRFANWCHWELTLQLAHPNHQSAIVGRSKGSLLTWVSSSTISASVVPGYGLNELLKRSFITGLLPLCLQSNHYCVRKTRPWYWRVQKSPPDGTARICRLSINYEI